jgi:hypothetical protein
MDADHAGWSAGHDAVACLVGQRPPRPCWVPELGYSV